MRSSFKPDILRMMHKAQQGYTSLSEAEQEVTAREAIRLLPESYYEADHPDFFEPHAWVKLAIAAAYELGCEHGEDYAREAQTTTTTTCCCGGCA